MELHLFSNAFTTLFALATGIFFGFLLRRAGVSRFDTIVGQLLLKDFTVMKVILTAIVVGSLGIYSLEALGMIPTFHLSETPILFSLLGGAIFGVGMSIAGYCPGTAIASLAEGSKDMIFGLIGMIFGAFMFNEMSPIILPYINRRDFTFHETIGSFFAVPHWIAIAGVVAIWIIFALTVKIYERKGKLISV
ncbi:MAG: YeeE/YedE family protein [Simkaniaceae bacterium]|nr:MAG: YeeE/YedE family protein [Simkaniaceae bacterium]